MERDNAIVHQNNNNNTKQFGMKTLNNNNIGSGGAGVNKNGGGKQEDNIPENSTGFTALKVGFIILLYLCLIEIFLSLLNIIHHTVI